MLACFVHYYGVPGQSSLESVLNKEVLCVLCLRSKFFFNVWCSRSRSPAWQVCHIQMRSEGGSNQPHNLLPVCASCTERAPHLPMLEFVVQTMPWRLVPLIEVLHLRNPSLHKFETMEALVSATYLPEGAKWSRELLAAIKDAELDFIEPIGSPLAFDDQQESESVASTSAATAVAAAAGQKRKAEDSADGNGTKMQRHDAPPAAAAASSSSAAAAVAAAAASSSAAAAAAASPPLYSAAQWLKDIGCSSMQRELIASELPDGEPSLLLLSCFTDNQLASFGFKEVQINAWHKLSDKHVK